MARITEIEALTKIDRILADLEDPEARDRTLRWASEKYSSEPVPPQKYRAKTSNRTTTKKTARGSGQSKKTSSGKKARKAISIVKELNLKPKGKASFRAFADGKKPSSNFEKCAVAVFYLQHEHDGISAVSASHVYTCFKEMSWRTPADLLNTLRVTASKNGWLDTADSDNIVVTPHGENLVEHDLPKKSDSK